MRVTILLAGLAIAGLAGLAWLGWRLLQPAPPVVVVHQQPQQGELPANHPSRDPDRPVAVYMTPSDDPAGLRRKLHSHDAGRPGIDVASVLGMKNGLRSLPADQLPKFVTCMTQDNAGKIWVGTETQGVFAYDPAKNAWKQFTPPDGLSQYPCYSIACDQQGRIWVGHLNRGLTVYNGQTWRTYDVLRGPLGDRVFAVRVCPIDGSVWIANNAALTRYDVKRNEWSNRTPDEGIPFNHIQAIAFDPKGNLYLGTQSDGIAIADAADGYATWRTVRGPDTIPVTASGAGLPSNLINDVLVAHDGTVFAATDGGLARSADRGHSWTYLRGKDWADKVRGLIAGPPPGWHDTEKAVLAEDYCTCLAEDRAGMLWVGHHAEGCEAIDPATNRVVYLRPGKPDGSVHEYVTAILPRAGQAPVIGRYPGAPIEAETWFDHQPIPIMPAPKVHLASLTLPATRPTTQPAIPQPTSIHPLTLAEMNRTIARLAAVPPADPPRAGSAVTLDDDWRTAGDWTGRYGRYSAYFCASSFPELIWNPGPTLIDYHPSINSAFANRDALRHWVQWQYTTNPNSLELQSVYLDSRVVQHLTRRKINRRQSEWDDHGESYPIKIEGPNVYCRITIPAGTFRLSLYDFNKDGHYSLMRFRDYRVLIRGHASAGDSSDEISDDTGPVLAQSRIRDFAAGGVYARFLIRGPAVYTFEIDRNYSQNAILAGVFLDLLDEFPPPYFADLKAWQSQLQQREQQRRAEIERWSDPARRAAAARPATNETEAAGRLWDELQRAGLRNEAWAATASRAYYRDQALWYGFAAQKATSQTKDEVTRRLTACYYHSDLYPLWEDCLKQLKIRSAREIEKSLRWDHVTDSYRGREFIVIRSRTREEEGRK
jgi:hypothetical protein